MTLQQKIQNEPYLKADNCTDLSDVNYALGECRKLIAEYGSKPSNRMFSDLKKGDYVKREGRSIELKVIEVGKDTRSKKNFVKLFNDVTNYTTTVVDLSEYKKA